MGGHVTIDSGEKVEKQETNNRSWDLDAAICPGHAKGSLAGLAVRTAQGLVSILPHGSTLK